MQYIDLSNLTVSIHPLNKVGLSLIKTLSENGLENVRINRYQSNIKELYPNINFIKSEGNEIYNCDLYIHTSFSNFVEVSKTLFNIKCQHIIAFVKGVYIFNYNYLPYFRHNYNEGYDVIVKVKHVNNGILINLDETRNVYNNGDEICIYPEKVVFKIKDTYQNSLLLEKINNLKPVMKMHYILPCEKKNNLLSIEECINNDKYILDSVNKNDLIDIVNYSKNNPDKRVVNNLQYLDTLCSYKCLDCIQQKNIHQIWYYKSIRFNNNIEKNIIGKLNFSVKYNEVSFKDDKKYNHIINITNDCKVSNDLELYSLINNTPFLNVEYENNQCHLNWVIPFKTTFLSKNIIKPMKEFKECVIQAPYHYEHCISWAKDVLCQLNHFDNINLVDAVIYILKVLYQIYEKNIIDIQLAHPLEEINEKGQYYWTYPRNYPTKFVYEDISIDLIQSLINFVTCKQYDADIIKEVIKNIDQSIIRNENAIELSKKYNKIDTNKHKELIYTLSSYRCINYHINITNCYEKMISFIINENYISKFILLRGIIKAFEEVENYNKNKQYYNHIISYTDIKYIPEPSKKIFSKELDPIMMCPIIALPNGHDEWDSEILNNMTIIKLIDYINDKYPNIYISEIYGSNKLIYSNGKELEYANLDQFAEENKFEGTVELIVIANDEHYNILQLPKFIYIVE